MEMKKKKGLQLHKVPKMGKIPLESSPESARLSTSEVVNQPDNQMATVSDSDTISYEYQLSSPKTEPDLVSMGSALRTDDQNKDSPSYMGTVAVANPDIRLASDKSKNVKKKKKKKKKYWNL